MLVWFAENPVDVEAMPVASAVVILITLVGAEIQVSRPGDGRSPFMAFLNALFFLATLSHSQSTGPFMRVFVPALLDSATSYVLGRIRFALVRFGRDFHYLLGRHLAFALSSRFLEMDLPCCLHYTVSTENNANHEDRKSPWN